MQTSELGKISIGASKLPRSKFNFSHDYNTTMDFGTVFPIMSRLINPDTKTTLSKSFICRLAPMVAPTFGRMHFKTWSQFISCSDIFRNFDQLLSQTPVTRSSGTFVPLSVPTIPLNLLTCFCLVGSSLSVYLDSVTTDSSSGENLTGIYNPYLADSPGAFVSYFDDYFSAGSASPTQVTSWLKIKSSLQSNTSVQTWSKQGLYLDLNFCLYGSELSYPFYVPIQSTSYSVSSDNEVLACVSQNGFMKGDAYVGYKKTEWSPLTGSDLVYTRHFKPSGMPYRYVHYAFTLSSFGKRLRKLLLGCGYQLSLSDPRPVSMLPLLACFKAYYDLFAVQRKLNWENTATARIMSLMENGVQGTYSGSDKGSPSFASLFGYREYSSLCVEFIQELANMFYTAPVDYYSAMTDTPVESPSADGALKFIDFDGSFPSNIDLNTEAGNHAFIDAVNHSANDSEFLKRLLRWTNINTIAGKRVAELLRAQGLGDYVDSHKSNFIGSTSSPITISDVVSQSDTFSEATGSGSLLGEYGGRGLATDQSKTDVFETNCFGFYVVLGCLVPESGYYQGLDGTLGCLSKFDFYNREFDALGYDATPLDEICGNEDFSYQQDTIFTPDGTSSPQSGAKGLSTFGFAPRYSRLKVMQNVVNGDMSLRSSRDAYLPYHLDKFIDLNGCDVSIASTGVESVRSYKMLSLLRVLPKAGDTWRFPSRYPWIGNLNRIFANVGNYNENFKLFNSVFSKQAQLDFTLCHNTYDNFMIHLLLNFVVYSPMLPIEKSYQTTDDERGANMDMSKA